MAPRPRAGCPPAVREGGPPEDREDGRVDLVDDRRAGADHEEEVVAADGTGRAGECAPSRLRE